MKLPPLPIFGIPITQGPFEIGPSIQSNTILDWSGMGPIWQKWGSYKLSLNLACFGHQAINYVRKSSKTIHENLKN